MISIVYFVSCLNHFLMHYYIQNKSKFNNMHIFGGYKKFDKTTLYCSTPISKIKWSIYFPSSFAKCFQMMLLRRDSKHQFKQLSKYYFQNVFCSLLPLKDVPRQCMILLLAPPLHELEPLVDLYNIRGLSQLHDPRPHQHMGFLWFLSFFRKLITSSLKEVLLGSFPVFSPSSRKSTPKCSMLMNLALSGA